MWMRRAAYTFNHDPPGNMGIDESGIERLFKQHYTALVMYAHKWLRSQEEAEDVVQEVFAGLCRNRENLDPQGNLRAYLFTATYNRCVSRYRRSRPPTLAIDAFSDAPVGEENNIEAEMNTAELRAAIYEEIRKLPDKCRETFLLSRTEEMSYKDIANHLNLSVKTVENHIGNALKRIRKRLFFDDDSPWKGQFFSWLLLLFQTGSPWFGNNFERAGIFSAISLGGEPLWGVPVNRVRRPVAFKCQT